MTSEPLVTVCLGEWTQLAERAMPIRHQVFVKEQQVPPELELDEFDPVSCHALALLGEQPIGTGRLLPDGHIGRMAVLAEWRGQQVGSRLLSALLAEAQRRGMRQVVLNAQTHAMAFYTRFGFVPVGEEYQEAGLPHHTMARDL